MRRRTSPAQQIPNGAGGWPSFPRRTRLPVVQPSHQLLGTPGRMIPPSQDQAFYHVALHPVRMLMGCPAEIAQPIPTPGLEALNSFVAGLPADAKGSAQIHEGLSPCFPSLYEPSLLRFSTRTFPRHHFPPHRRLDYPLGKCYLCARFKCYQSTRFIPSLTLPRKGGKNKFLPPRWGKVRMEVRHSPSDSY